MGTIYRNSTLYGGGGGSGGHNILDNDGNTLPQEDNLQFKGLDVTDNSADGITEVEALGLNQDDLDELSTEGIKTGFVQSSFNYSTEEQIVGRWVDGKPLYQKTVNCGTSLSIMNHNIANIDQVVEARGVGFGNHGDGYNIPFAGTNWIQCYADRTKIDLQPATTGWNLGGGIYITLKYTKTTD